MKKAHILFYAITCLLSFSMMANGAVTDYESKPVTIIENGDPNVLLDLSVEWPVTSSAYGEFTPASCRGTSSGEPYNQCYDSANTYLGYFESDKCYDYNGAWFIPTASTGNHECSNQWSGNMLNWATMSSLDIIRSTLMGGTRNVDTATSTLLLRARLPGYMNNATNNFPAKRIDASDNVDPTTVMPGTIGGNSITSGSTVYLVNDGWYFYVCNNANCATVYDTFAVQIEVCDATKVSTIGIGSNCKQYSSGNYKPVGLIQKNADKMRFGLMSYLLDNDVGRNGGVLRARMKYVGPLRPAAGGGYETNPNAEWDATTGIMNWNPDTADSTANGVLYSGVTPYLHAFGHFTGTYKSYDPVSEIYYECLRYYKNLGPTAEYSSGLASNDGRLDNFPAITNWNDPITHQCQNNYIVAINDAFPHRDKRLPGTFFTTSTFTASNGDTYDIGADGADYGEPDTVANTGINVTTLTNTVGTLEGINNSSFEVGCSAYACDRSCNNKQIGGLGEVMGTCPPNGGRNNTYYIAGLAYYANTTDLRTSIPQDQTVRTFMIDVMEYNDDPPLGAQNPLWLTGKYGGFVDTNGNNQPDLTSEWDEDGDGEPDNYVRANSPENIVTGLTNAFEGIVERVSAGTAAAVIADTVSFTGSVIQALYQPRLVTETAAVEWVGLMHSVFIDQYGNLREDSDSDGQLDGDGDAATDDKIIQILYADDVSHTMLYYCTTTDNGVTATCPARNTPSANRVELENLKPIWNVRDQLATIPDSLIDVQRDYDTAFNDASNGGRYIITWLDANEDGNVESSEVVDFDEDSFTNTNHGTLAAADQTEADNIVNWIRGKEISGYRNRTIDYDGDGTDEVWRLGDIVHSTPYVVSKPAGSIIGGQTIQWDVKYGDPTYSQFRNQYRNRRNVVIVGANDGMIHAFNAGFFNSNLKKYELTRTQEAHETAAPVSHPLGAELWAYVPKNLQPQLKFLTQPDYPHVYYMDGKARVFDVNIFPDDTTHPKGWGTILVMGMRFGGGTKGTAINVSNDNDAAIEYQTTSAYVILDITDPELPPHVLGEYADVDHGFTTSAPDLMVRRAPQALTFSYEPADVASNDWYLVFGTGPTDLSSATSTQNAKLVALKLDYDTTNNALDMASSNVVEIDTGVANSFVGDPATIDFTKRPVDYNTDAIYFGISGGTAASPTGQLMRVAITSDTTSDWQSASNRGALINPSVGQSFITRPYVKGITQFETDFIDMWVYAGTGRLYTNADNQSNQVQSLYGLRDRGTVSYRDIPDTTMTLTTDLASATNLGLPNPPDNTYVQNVTGITIAPDGTVAIPAGLLSDFPAGTDTYLELETEMNKRSGWYIDLPVGATASERNVTDSINFDGFQIFTTYMPSGDACTAEGEGYIYVVDEKTGTAFPDRGLATASDTTLTPYKKTLGVGLPSEVTLFENLGGTRPIIQMSTGEIVDKFKLTGKPPEPYSTGRQSWREIFNF